jgi:PAS domain S-box-containing protein
MKFRAQIVVAALGVTAVVLVAMLAYIVGQDRSRALVRLQESIERDAQLLQVVTAGPLYDGNQTQLAAIVDSIRDNPDLVAVELKETRGDIAVVRSRSPAPQAGESIVREVRVMRGADELGRYRLTYSTAHIEAQLRRSRDEMIRLSLGLVAGLALVILLLAARLTRPIERLTRAAQAIAEGDLQQPLDARGSGETAILEKSFERMRDAVRQKVAELEAANRQLTVEVQERTRAEHEALRLIGEHQAVTQAIHDILYMVDTQARLVWWNRRTELVLGVEAQALQRAPALQFFAEADRAAVAAAVQNAVVEGYGEVEADLLTPGGPVAHHFNGVRLVDSEGRVVGVAGVGTDISGRRRAEEDLRVKENAIATSASAIAIADARGAIFYVNPAFLHLWGLAEAREVLGRTPDEFAAEPADALAIMQALQHRDTYFGEFRGRHKEGSVFVTQVSASAIRDGAGVVTHMMGSFVDISVRKAQEVALRQSEQRFRALVDLSSDWFWQTDADHRFIYREGEILRRMGIPPEDDYGKRRWEMPFTNMSEADWERHRAQLARHEEFRDLLLQRLSPNGRVYWATISGKPLFDDGGRFIGYHGTGRDITAQIEAEEALRASEARISRAYATLNDAIESGPSAVAIYDADDRLLACNTRFRAFYDFDPAFVQVGREFVDLIGRYRTVTGATSPGLTGPDWLERRRRLHQRPEGPIEMHLPSGQWMQIVERHTSEGGVVTIYNDITELKGREAELLRLNESLEARVGERTAELAAANRELESFASSVAHDLRAPLRGIDGFGKLLDEHAGSTLDATSRGYMQRIRASAQRMGQLIDDLLRFSRVGRGELHRRSVDLSVMARSVAEELQRSAPERAVRWTIADGVRVHGDPGLLHLVLENLLGNAWKYTSKTTQATIEFGTATGGGRQLFVRDNGAGFNMAHAKMLFQPFRRLHGQHEFEGTGIGLATVRRIIERHGGRIEAQAAVGQGATFTFNLPDRP